MRTIKFRGWHKLSKRMYGVGYLHFAPNGELYGLLADETTEWGNMLAADDFELMQYTGLKDKNGKEIYEGDIVKVDGIVYRIVFDSAMFMLTSRINDEYIMPLTEAEDNIEVIGNIYENPELLQ